MALHSNPKELGPHAGCRDCFWTVQGWMFGAILDSPKLNLRDYFSDSSGLNLGIVFGQSETEITRLLWAVGIDLRPKLVHVYCLGVIDKMYNMIGCLKIMLLRHAQLMY